MTMIDLNTLLIGKKAASHDRAVIARRDRMLDRRMAELRVERRELEQMELLSDKESKEKEQLLLERELLKKEMSQLINQSNSIKSILRIKDNPASWSWDILIDRYFMYVFFLITVDLFFHIYFNGNKPIYLYIFLSAGAFMVLFKAGIAFLVLCRVGCFFLFISLVQFLFCLAIYLIGSSFIIGAQNV